LGRPDHDEREMGHLVDYVVADPGDVIDMARHLPDALPDALDLAIVPLLRQITIGRNAGDSARHRRLELQRVRHTLRVSIECQQLGIRDRRGSPTGGRIPSWVANVFRIGSPVLSGY